MNKINQKDLALDHIKQKYIKLINNLENNKIFLNMAVHDMRNPTSQIEYVLKNSLQKLYSLKKTIEGVTSKIDELDLKTSTRKKKRVLQSASFRQGR